MPKTPSVNEFFIPEILLLLLPVILKLDHWIICTCILMRFARIAYMLDEDDENEVMDPKLLKFLKDRALTEEKTPKKEERPLRKGELKVALLIKSQLFEIKDEFCRNLIIRQILCNPTLYDHATKGKGKWSSLNQNIHEARKMQEAHQMFHGIVDKLDTIIAKHMGQGTLDNWGNVLLVIPPLQRVLLPFVTDEDKRWWDKEGFPINLHPLLPLPEITLSTGFYVGGYRGPYESKAFESR